jgi:hypothetical protein
MTVIQPPRFLRDARRIMADTTREALVDYLAANPLAGVLIPDTGGARKIRFAPPGGGKRGGFRAIYYYHDETVPVLLLAAFAKNVRVDLSPSERAGLKSVLADYARDYKRRRK